MRCMCSYICYCMSLYVTVMYTMCPVRIQKPILVIFIHAKKRTKFKNSIFRYKNLKRAVFALRVWKCYIFTRAASESPVWPHVSNHIFLYKCMRNASWLTVYRHQKCASTQLHSTAVNTTILK